MDGWLSEPLWVAVIAALIAPAIGTIFWFGQWKGRVDTDRDTFKGTLSEIRSDIKKIFERLPSSTVAGESPLRLTELGRAVSDSLDAGALAEELAAHLREEAEGKQPYEIQEMAFNHVKEEWTPADAVDARIKSVAYENGLKREQVLDVVAIELRNKLLAMTKGGILTHPPGRVSVLGPRYAGATKV